MNTEPVRDLKSRLSSNIMTILYIDDDNDDRDILVEASQFFRPDLRVIAVASVMAGLDIIKTESIDVIVVDFSMPDMDGSVLLERLAELRKEAKVYMYSNYMTEADKARCKELGAQDCFQKPSTFNEIGKWLDCIAIPH